MGCSSSKSPAVPAAGKEEFTGAADSQVATETQPQVDAEKQAAKAAPVAEVKTETPSAEEPKVEQSSTEAPKAEELKNEESKAEEPKSVQPQAEEPKNDEPKTDEPKAEEQIVEAAKIEEPKIDDAKTELPAEQAALDEPEIGIKVTGADGPPAACTCSLW